MKIAVFGTGGVGGYLGGLLAHAGHEVAFIARGEHLAAIQSHGLRVRSVNGDFTISPCRATDDPAEIGPVEYLLVAVKHYHLKAIVPHLRPLVGPGTTVVPLLNGVDAHEIIAAEFGEGPVVGGLCSLSSMIESPGVIYQPSQMRRVVVGELDRTQSERVAKLVNAWKETGVDAIQPPDIYVAMWNKFLFIASFGGVSSLARANAGIILGNPESRQLLIDAMQEVHAVAQAKGIAQAPDVVETTLKMFSTFEPSTTPSIQRDVVAGSPFELEAFSGKVVHLGRELGVPTPIHRSMYALLLPILEQAVAA